VQIVNVLIVRSQARAAIALVAAAVIAVVAVVVVNCNLQLRRIHNRSVARREQPHVRPRLCAPHGGPRLERPYSVTRRATTVTRNRRQVQSLRLSLRLSESLRLSLRPRRCVAAATAVPSAVRTDCLSLPYCFGAAPEPLRSLPRSASASAASEIAGSQRKEC
jgi:hypothetical protein